MKRAVATQRVREEWSRRVEAEYRSAVLTHHLVLWVLKLGLSPDLVTLGARIVRDELAHASLSAKVHAAAGGGPRAPIDQTTLGLREPSRSLAEDTLSACVETFCLGETVAVPLFSRMRKGCDVPSARRALDRILRDEVRHRDFGFLLLGALLDAAPSLRARAEAGLPAMVARLRDAYGREAEPVTPDERRWGLIGADEYRTTLERSLVRDHAPRFARLGITLLVA